MMQVHYIWNAHENALCLVHTFSTSLPAWLDILARGSLGRRTTIAQLHGVHTELEIN